jgi:hypothetical protein
VEAAEAAEAEAVQVLPQDLEVLEAMAELVVQVQ